MTDKKDNAALRERPVQPEVRWAKPGKINAIDIAFPANVIGRYLPTENEIPKEFWNDYNKYSRLASTLFFEGGSPGEFKDGISLAEAIPHLQCALGSFEPKHEHKIAGVGYLLSLWLK